jgi:hypothetical protein
MATDGHQRVIELAQFSHGRWAFQASVVAGEPVSPEARQPFFDGFRWAPGFFCRPGHRMGLACG